MIDTYINEYLGIVKYLILKNPKAIKVRKNSEYEQLIVHKKDLEQLLNHNMYALSNEKLKLWRQLNLILTEKDRFTKKVYAKGYDKRVQMICINLKTYRVLSSLYGE